VSQNNAIEYIMEMH